MRVRLTVYLSAIWRASTWLWRIPSSTRSLQGQKIDWLCMCVQGRVSVTCRRMKVASTKSSNNSALRKARDVFFASAETLFILRAHCKIQILWKRLSLVGIDPVKSALQQRRRLRQRLRRGPRISLRTTHTRYPVAFGCMVSSPFVGQQHQPWWFVTIFVFILLCALELAKPKSRGHWAKSFHNRVWPAVKKNRYLLPSVVLKIMALTWWWLVFYCFTIMSYIIEIFNTKKMHTN